MQTVFNYNKCMQYTSMTAWTSRDCVDTFYACDIICHIVTQQRTLKLHWTIGHMLIIVLSGDSCWSVIMCACVCLCVYIYIYIYLGVIVNTVLCCVRWTFITGVSCRGVGTFSLTKHMLMCVCLSVLLRVSLADQSVWSVFGHQMYTLCCHDLLVICCRMLFYSLFIFCDASCLYLIYDIVLRLFNIPSEFLVSFWYWILCVLVKLLKLFNLPSETMILS